MARNFRKTSNLQHFSETLFQYLLKSNHKGLACCRSKFNWNELCSWQYPGLLFPCPYLAKSLDIFPSDFLDLQKAVHLHSILCALYSPNFVFPSENSPSGHDILACPNITWNILGFPSVSFLITAPILGFWNVKLIHSKYGQMAILCGI